MPKEKSARHRFDESIESQISGKVYNEYTTSKSNLEVEMADYSSVVDMMECKRSEKSYSWMSDIFVPELPSIVLTDAGGWASQYFQSRDFVEVRLEADDPKGVEKCRAVKNAINKTLNVREIYHYPKYIRGRLINSLAGIVYALEWWDRETTQEQIGTETSYEPVDGSEGTYAKVDRPKFRDKVVKDHYNYEIIDPANVFTDNGYCYNVQDKQYVIFRSEKTIEQLDDDKISKNYINLNVIRELLNPKSETETSRESFNKTDRQVSPSESPQAPFDYLERYGRHWVVVTSRQDDGFPSSCEPGYDEDGKKEKAEFIECVMGISIVGGEKVLTRLEPQTCKDPSGKAYRPILRGLCYIHPRKDTGLADGKYLREPQIAINDAYNMSSDRTTLATLPTLIGRRNAVVDNDTLYFEPEHIMEVENPKEDLVELRMRDNTDSALNLLAMLAGKMQQVSSVYPTTMGALPDKASTTATAVAGSESRSNLRANYKSLTYEYTFLIDQYCHILWMIAQYATKETAHKLMGEGMYTFDPNADYTYTPLTSQIEAEHGKQKKLQIYDQILGRVVGLKHPDTVKIVGYILSKTFELLGDEFSAFKNILPDPTKPITEKGEDVKDGKAPPTSNQQGMEQSSMEQMTRDSAGTS